MIFADFEGVSGGVVTKGLIMKKCMEKDGSMLCL